MKSTGIFLFKKLSMFCLLALFGLGLINCGGGGSDSGSGQTVSTGTDEADGEGDGNDGGDGNGGEGAGQCRSLNLERFYIKLVEEKTPSSAPPREKQLVIETISGSPENRDLELRFTTNNGMDDSDTICDEECGNSAFLAEYEQAFGVYNTDCH